MPKPKVAETFKTEIRLIVESDHKLSPEEIKQVERCMTGDWVYPLSFDLQAFKAKP